LEDVQQELDEPLPASQLQQLRADDDADRPDLAEGVRVKLATGSAMWAAENIPSLVDQVSRGVTIKDVHGIIRVVNKRNFLVQWFVAGVEARLYEVIGARLYACFPSEFVLEAERKFNPLYK